jgi:hypothetical protein
MAVRSRQGHRGFISWDGLGAALSIGCAIHCASIPLLFGLWPGAVLALRSVGHEHHRIVHWLLWSHQMEGIVVGILLLFAATVLLLGLRRHHRVAPLWLAGCSAAVLLYGTFGGAPSLLAHVGMQVLGGIGIGMAHILNLRALRSVACCAAHPV